jgi:hypothetical protein
MKVKRIFLDMDGVCTDFDKRFAEIVKDDKIWNESFGKLNLTSEQLTELRTESLDCTSPMRVIQAYLTPIGMKEDRWAAVHYVGTDFWTGMDWMKGGEELVEFLLNQDVPVEILTAGYAGNACLGKINWLRGKGLEQLTYDTGNTFNICKHGVEKGKYAEEGDLLIDDTSKNIELFREAGGMAIHHTDTTKTIQEVKEYLDNERI